ncbi:hypothetical protein IFM89_028722 [Coptis chinensis]|uniref:Pentatricopeptide repeat-containing protein n=1 Tax=Coptis chinensis TaxID=261450 RepID=A0A835H111_9MAGN|nr:hypothetical protein IFM89_028722 [Coptis chinensis]
MPEKDLASWNSVIATYSAVPDVGHEALVLFKEMVFSGVRADNITLVILFSACVHIGGMEYGRGIHGYVIKVGVGCGLNLRNALLSMYAKGGEIDSASQVFHEMAGERDVVSHTIVINGFVELGLVDEARKIFNELVVKDSAAWNSMINGYVKVSRPKEALELFKEMDKDMASPDENTIVSVLSACASLSDLQLVWEFGRGSARFLQNGTQRCFAWTAAITGLAGYGHGKEALSLFKNMENESIKLNEATFVSVLMACSRSGLVEEGCILFGRMVGFYKIQPTIEHFGCLVDLFSRAGLLVQAEKFIESMPTEERLVAYKTLLSATISYSRIDLGEQVATKLINLKPCSHEVYILLSNFYASAGQWDKVTEMRKFMKNLDKRKEVGISFVEAKA